MNEFQTLRAKARQNRDNAIDRARADYDSAMARIAQLERDLNGNASGKSINLSACMDSVIPSEGEFSTDDLVGLLEARYPETNWPKRTVCGHVYRLRRAGILRRLTIHKKGEPSKYARNGAVVEERPFGDKSLEAVMVETMGGKAMSILELTVAILEAGFQTTTTKSGLRAAIGGVLRKSGRFVKSGQRWTTLRA